MNRLQRCGIIKGYATALLLMILFFPCMTLPKKEGINYYTIYINGEEAGHTDSPDISEYVRAARLKLSKEHEGMYMADPKISVEGKSSWIGMIDGPSKLADIFAGAITEAVRETLHPAYLVKVGKTSVSLGSHEETMELLNRILEPYDNESLYKAQMISDPNRELSVLSTSIVRRSDEERANSLAMDYHKAAGASQIFDAEIDIHSLDTNKDLTDYELGLTEIEFGKPVEVVQTYLPVSELDTVDEAIDRLTLEQEQQIIYEVVSGDSLSQIAEDHGIPMDRIIEINPTIESERDTIKIGDKIIITQPKPELSVVYSELDFYEEDYEAEVQYVDNSSWFTNQQKVLQQPSAGHRMVLATVSYENDQVTGEKVEREELIIEAIPKIVERGTIIPPTFLKPISGGRMSSKFGRRTAPTKGASTYHKGIDWAVPVGTAVVASSGGTVTKAGWASGYGYVVYINHGNGKESRYGHLSRVLVKAGQKVRQGEKVALSGNTGRSTGPHLHFEIYENGVAVDPLKLLS